MRIQITKPIVGHKQGDETKRFLHADTGDILQVVFNNHTHFICESKNYLNQPIVVFNNQCVVIDRAMEDIVEDPHEAEKYYHVYEDNSKSNLDDPFYTAFEDDDSVD